MCFIFKTGFLRQRTLRVLSGIFSFCALLSLFAADALAKSMHELNYFQAGIVSEKPAGKFFTKPETFYRIEIGVKNGEPEFTAAVDEKEPKRLIIKLAQTKRGELKDAIALDPHYAKQLAFKDEKRRTLAISVDFAGRVSRQGYRLNFAKADRRINRPDRLVLDILHPSASLGLVQLDSLSGKSIVIDPGHGGSDRGAKGPVGSQEKDITLQTSLILRDILEGSGMKVIMTREDDRDVFVRNATDRQELAARVAVAARQKKLDVFLSVHCDAFTSPKANGTGTFFFPKTPNDQLLAAALQRGMVRHGNRRDRGIKQANFFVIKYSNVPAALVELAFISNPWEERLLSNPDFQRKLALGIRDGLAEFFAGRIYDIDDNIKTGSGTTAKKSRHPNAAGGSLFKKHLKYDK